MSSALFSLFVRPPLLLLLPRQTIRAGDLIHGLTVSAFASVSAEPPLIAVIIDNRHRAKELFEEEGASFAVNILHHEQRSLSNRFAWVKDENRFAEGNWGTAETGAPVLSDALAWLDCRIHSRFPVGTHTIYVGEVVASSVPEAGVAPLVYWNRGYRQLHLSEAEATDASVVAGTVVREGDDKSDPE